MLHAYWVLSHVPSRWSNYQLPKTETERNKLGAIIGRDGQTLLRAIDEASELTWLDELPAIKTLRQVWSEQYVEVDGEIRLREVKDMPSPQELIVSPWVFPNKRHKCFIGFRLKPSRVRAYVRFEPPTFIALQVPVFWEILL